MNRPPLLESLLTAFDKTEALRADTEALKPRLEREINSALGGGEALDEKLATSLQTKRAQLEMTPAKLGQISAKSEELLTAIQAEFNSRFKAFNSELQVLESATKKKVMEALSPLMVDALVVEELTNRMIWTRTKLAVELSGLESAINFQLTNQNIIGAVRELLKREKELALIKARPEFCKQAKTA
jgi:hypothetical protein